MKKKYREFKGKNCLCELDERENKRVWREKIYARYNNNRVFIPKCNRNRMRNLRGFWWGAISLSLR